MCGLYQCWTVLYFRGSGSLRCGSWIDRAGQRTNGVRLVVLIDASVKYAYPEYFGGD